MNTLPKYYRFILFLILVIVSIQLGAQVNSVNKYLADVDQKVEQINQLANNKQVYQAITLLNETRRDLDSYVNLYLEDELRKAKAEDPSFGPFINVQFSSVLTAAYWEERVQKAQESIDLAKEAMADSHHNRTLDTQDEAWSYLKTVYGVGKTIKDVADNVSKAQFFDAVKSAQEGVDGFIENYKEIENARLQIINTQLYETTINGLIRRGEIMEEKAWQFSSFMRTYEQDVNDFYQIVGRLNQKIDQIKREEVVDWNSADYSWNKQTYLNQINAVAQQFKQGDFDYSTLKEKIEAINEQAENDKIGIFQNIQNSGANDAFERGNQLEEEFNEFYDLSIDVLDECYAFEQNREKETTQNSDIATESNSSSAATIATPSGTRKPNSLYHGVWKLKNSTGSWQTFKQNGNSVKGVNGTGRIVDGKLIFTPRSDLIYTYYLIGDGYKMKQILQKNGSIIREGIYEYDPITYEGGPYDSDGDGVHNDYDNCSNTPVGLTFNNGGVDIAGCPTGQGGSSLPTASATTNANSSQPKQKTPSSSNSANTTNSFAGASAGKSTNNSYPGQSKSNQSKTSTTASNSSSQTSSKKEAKKVSTAINKMPKTGFTEWARIPVYYLKENDKLVFRQTGLNSKFLKFKVRWVGKNFSEVLYEETKQIVYSTAELMSKCPQQAIYIDFRVNKDSDTYGRMEAWVFPKGVPIPAEWNIKDNSGNSGSNNGGNDFYELISKADEAFNKKYWTESGGARATSNPKQESFDYLRKAQPLIAQQQDVTQRYSMVLTLASKYAEYAKRVFANTAKNDFIQTAGSLLGQYGGAATSVKDAKAKAYNNIADGWRELTKAAMWGGHQYNKAACDVEAKKYYDLALREDRNNVQLQKTVEKINAPKKAVPAAVAATKPIPESSWAKAENLRNMIVENTPIQLDDEPHYSEIGQMKIDMGSINVGSGKVWLLRSGAKDWELVSKSGEYIFVGDKIKTSDDAKNISFDYSEDKTHLVIKSGSVVTFYLNQIYIERGDTEMYVKKRGKEFLVITPKAVTGCRGTEFSVKVDNSGTTDVHLFEGIVEMRNSTEISYLVPGQTAKVEKDDEAINVVQFNIQQHKQQFLSNQNQFNTTYQSNPFQNVTGGGRVVGGQ